MPVIGAITLSLEVTCCVALRDQTTIDRFGRDLDGRQHLAGSARHAAIGHQCHPEAAVLQQAEIRRQLVQLRHADGGRALVGQHGDKIGFELAVVEGSLEVLLRREHGRAQEAAAVLRVALLTR